VLGLPGLQGGPGREGEEGQDGKGQEEGGCAGWGQRGGRLLDGVALTIAWRSHCAHYCVEKPSALTIAWRSRWAHYCVEKPLLSLVRGEAISLTIMWMGLALASPSRGWGLTNALTSVLMGLALVLPIVWMGLALALTIVSSPSCSSAPLGLDPCGAVLKPQYNGCSIEQYGTVAVLQAKRCLHPGPGPGHGASPVPSSSVPRTSSLPFRTHPFFSACAPTPALAGVRAEQRMAPGLALCNLCLDAPALMHAHALRAVPRLCVLRMLCENCSACGPPMA